MLMASLMTKLLCMMMTLRIALQLLKWLHDCSLLLLLLLLLLLVVLVVATQRLLQAKSRAEKLMLMMHSQCVHSVSD